MDIEQKGTEENVATKPQIFVKGITFNDGTELTLNHSSIVVFTGANNCGKSQILRDIEQYFDASNSSPTVVIKGTECDYLGSIYDSTFLKERFFVNKNGNYQVFGSSNAFGKETLTSYWKNKTLYGGLHKLFVKRLCTEYRLTASNALIRNDQPEKHPIFKLNESETLAQTLLLLSQL